ncbi:SHQ1-domain-containing protein [Gloeopeniophorella convolvens]|nr:SHQ1-domain-containing protein [Gloeopeniophorella convolvens]
MITPRFSCSQTDRSIIVSAYCPAVRASEIEIHVEETLFSLHVAPYFLRLNFPGSVTEDDHSSAVYDPTSGYLTLTLTKKMFGEKFPDLDLLGKLLAPPSRSEAHKPNIEVIGSQENTEGQVQFEEITAQSTPYLQVNGRAAEHRQFIEAATNDWTMPQEIPGPSTAFQTSETQPYGFLNAYTGYFRHVATTENEINELGADAETLTPYERHTLRVKHEDSKWDPEYYMADFADDQHIRELLSWSHPHSDDGSPIIFTESENAAMLHLPRKEYLASSQETASLHLLLMSILWSYAYDSRTTQHDPTPESAWTISVLTPAFSALDPPLPPTREVIGDSTITEQELVAAFIPSYRRSLAFPLYRSWALAEVCRMDVARFLIRGRRAVLRCLLEMRAILDAHEVYYVYSRIWLDDLCRWIQVYAKEDTLVKLGQDVKHLIISKNSLGWDLGSLERMVQATAQEPSDSDDEVVAELRP